MRPVQLKSIVESAIDAMRPSVQDKQLTMSCGPGVGEGTMLGDPDRLPQVVTNLLGNAVKFTPANGRIDVKLDRMNGYLRLRVSDSGRGIPAAFLPHVFDRFRQADSTSTRSHGGLGIGLTIVRHIVELHGGTVEAQSAGEARGSTFTVHLPAIEAAKAPVEEAQSWSANADMPRAQLRGVTVLVVDDESDAREVVSNVLSNAGAMVCSASSPAEARKILEEVTPHVIISDIAMPEEDGYEFIRQLRATAGQSGAIPAIAMTAYVREEDRDKALACGFQAHIPKPIIPMELLLGVQRMAMRKGMTEQHSDAPASSGNVSQAV
jgi:CheY-like chemotaxis protein